MKNKSLLFLAILLSIFACQQNGKSVIVEQAPINQIRFEKINYIDSIQNIHCAENGSLSYSLFLPTAYKTEKNLPVIFIFDPHAEGLLPANKYKLLAEKYGFILAASNNSKNGMATNETNLIAQTIINDAVNRLNIDKANISLMGFSGGARVAATYINNFASANALILIGAGTPVEQLKSLTSLKVFMLAGKADFNSLELKNLNHQLNSTELYHDLLVFNGKHEWPDALTLEKVFKRLKVSIYPEKEIELKSSVIKDIESEFTSAVKENDLPQQLSVLKKELFFQSEKTKKDEILTKIQKLQNSKTYFSGIQNFINQLSSEQQLQQQYIQNFSSKDLDWWFNTSSIFKKIENKTNKTENDFQQLRLKGYLGLAAYMYANNALKSGDAQSVAQLISIYGILEPENPEPFVMKAILEFRNQQFEDGYQSLLHAVELGFTDEQRINSTPEFAALQNTPYQIQLLDEIHAKQQKK